MNEQARAFASKWRAQTIPGPRRGLVQDLNLLDQGNDRRPIVDPGTPVTLRVPRRDLRASVRLAVDREGRRVVSEVHLAVVRVELPDGSSVVRSGIDWKSLRAIALDQVLREVDTMIANEAGAGRLTARALKQLGERKHQSRVPRRYYAEVAARYARLRRSRSPLRDLAEQMNISYSAARDDIREARRLGYLTPTTRGKAGGDLTELASTVLAGGEG